MESTIADVNWLLSALAQATAALIAIVGGLLVSRYVALHAEQQAAGRRVQDLARREAEADEVLASANSELAGYRVADALDDDRVFDEIVARDFEPTVDGVLRAIECDEAELDLPLLEAEIESVKAEMAESIQAIYPLVPVGTAFDSWSGFRRANGLKPGRNRLWSWVYDRACDERREEAERAARHAREVLGNSVLSNLLNTRGFSLPNLSSAVTAARWTVQSQRELAQERALEERVAAAIAQLWALRQERRLAEETYEATRQPEGFGLALQTLSVLAVVGMGFPVVLMGLAVVTLPAWMRGSVIAMFFCGVALLLRFLFVYASFLREGGRASLPRSIFGLIR